MPRHSDIRVDRIHDDASLHLAFTPLLDEPVLEGLQGWLGHVPGIASVRLRAGSLAVRAANPFFSLGTLGEETRVVAEAYLRHSSLRDQFVADGGRYVVGEVLGAYYGGRKSTEPFRAQRFPAREADPFALFIIMNQRLQEPEGYGLLQALSGSVTAVRDAQLTDGGYNMQFSMVPICAGLAPKEHVAKEVIDLLSAHAAFQQNIRFD